MTQPVNNPTSRMKSNPTARKRPKPAPVALGDIWYRVEQSATSGEASGGANLDWVHWRCIQVGVNGVWFECCDGSSKEPIFVRTSGSKKLSRSRLEALDMLLARQERHLRSLKVRLLAAQQALAAAQAK